MENGLTTRIDVLPLRRWNSTDSTLGRCKLQYKLHCSPIFPPAALNRSFTDYGTRSFLDIGQPLSAIEPLHIGGSRLTSPLPKPLLQHLAVGWGWACQNSTLWSGFSACLGGTLVVQEGRTSFAAPCGLVLDVSKRLREASRYKSDG